VDLSELSPAAYQVFNASAEEMYKLKSGYFGVEHLFLGLLRAGGPEIQAVCARGQLNQDRFANTLRGLLQQETPVEGSGEAVFTPRVTRVQAAAGLVAAQRGAQSVEPIHLLVATLEEERSVPARVLTALQGEEIPSAKVLLDQARRLMAGELPADEKQLPAFGGGEESPMLAGFGRDLTSASQAGELDPVIGRDAAVLEIAGVLSRRQKSNALVVGDPGVGKTATVRGLAALMTSRKSLGPLQGMRLVELSIPALVAGTQMRGELEERFQAVLSEASAAGNVVLFLDDFHQLLAPGAGGELGGLLKSALANEDMRMVGAISTEGWEKLQSSDSGLARCFDAVRLEELSEADTGRVLRGLQDSFEEFHGIPLSEEAMDAAVTLTVRYVPDRRLPDKAIDAIDQACATSLLEGFAGDFSENSDLADTAGPKVLSEAEICRTVSRWTGIPLERVGGDEAQRLLGLEDALRNTVIGQEAAVLAAAGAVRAGRAGIADPNRPLAVLLFAGPTGVGKTELAKALAKEVFGSEDQLVRLDMTEFTEAHSVARLIGAPPGYVGHGDDGVLIQAVRKSPYTVILFDEIEKAHADVFDVLLPVFDEGRLQSSSGRMADMRNAILILTSNLLQETAEGPSLIGFGRRGEIEEPANPSGTPDEAELRAALCQRMRPEFVNRLDAVVPFLPLGPKELRLILERRLDKLKARAKEQGVVLDVEESAFDLLLAEGTDARFGARPLERAMDRLLRRPLAEELLQLAGAGGHLVAVAEKGKLSIHLAGE